MQSTAMLHSVDGHKHSTISKKNKKHQQKQQEPLTYYELLEIERRLNEPPKVRVKRHFPIAPDGYIPNSVVRKFFAYLEDSASSVAEKPVWKLKWKPPESETGKQGSERDSPVYVGKTLYFEWSDNEDEEGDEDADNKSADEDTSDIETAKKPISRQHDEAFASLINRLRAEEWFKLPVKDNDIKVEMLIKYLINKISLRDVVHHDSFCAYLKELSPFIRDKLLIEWIVRQLEDELDATDTAINIANCQVIEHFGIETYAIDLALMKLISQENDSEQKKELKKEAMRALGTVTGANEHQIRTAVDEIKKLQHNTKYKNNSKTFKLTEFVDEVETIAREIAANITNSGIELQKALLAEDWIAQHVKDGLKEMPDFLAYLLKSLKSVKSKIYYEKMANYVASFYREFKLSNTDWERQIVAHFVKSNTDLKTASNVSEAMRLIDINQLQAYYPSLQKRELKDEILLELVRSVAHETRTTVKAACLVLLKRLANLPEPMVFNLAEFYAAMGYATGTPSITSWKDFLHAYETRPVDFDEKSKKQEIPLLPTAPETSDTVEEKVDIKQKQAKKKVNKTKGQKRLEKPSSKADHKSPVKKEKAKDKLDMGHKTDEVESKSNIFSLKKKESWKYYHERNTTEQHVIDKELKEPHNESHKDNIVPNKQFQIAKHDSFDLDRVEGDFDLDALMQPIKEKDNPEMQEPHVCSKQSIQDIIDGITKRVIMRTFSDEDKHHPLDGSGEKGHLLVSDAKRDTQTSRTTTQFRHLDENQQLQDLQIHQLLECLIVRGLALHERYEKLLPTTRNSVAFVPIPYENDYLTVHPVLKTNKNAKSAKKTRKTQTPAEEKRDTPRHEIIEKIELNLDYLRSCANVYPIRRQLRTTAWRATDQQPASLNDRELNHIFLLNKLLVSYGSQNMRQFYTTINTHFHIYLKRLHARIPHRIVPLIWNDPVIQQLAKIVSRSYSDDNKSNPSESKQSMRSRISHNETPFRLPHIRKVSPASLAKQKESPMFVRLEPKLPKLNDRRINPLSKSDNIFKKPAHFWPMNHDQEEAPSDKAIKKKIYNRIMFMKHDYIKLQWRYMTQDRDVSISKTSESPYMPPLSVKANLNPSRLGVRS